MGCMVVLCDCMAGLWNALNYSSLACRTQDVSTVVFSLREADVVVALCDWAALWNVLNRIQQ